MADEQRPAFQHMLLRPQVFEELRQRYEQWRAGGFADLEFRMHSLIEKVNELPGLVTLSCDPGQPDFVNHGWWRGFHITAGLTEEGLGHLRYLWSNLHQILLERAKTIPVFGMVPRTARLEFRMLPNTNITTQMEPTEWVPLAVYRISGAHPTVIGEALVSISEEAVDRYNEARAQGL
jgi:hypothetical protein